MSTVQQAAVLQNFSEDVKEGAFRKAYWRLTPFLLVS